jgi:hypothetical protein
MQLPSSKLGGEEKSEPQRRAGVTMSAVQRASKLTQIECGFLKGLA